ncbi:MAG: winged helix-turn-helix domain-containing protein [Actinobacteria bacterium]|nr:winged helix-turn-helix domain-containing protein [Actinomycetota bacterium]
MGRMRERNDADEGGILILLSKLSPPRLHAIVPRNRLLETLGAAISVKLTCIVAGAGFGKSTLTADFLGQRGYPYAWYQLEDSDRDLSIFLAYLAAAFDQHGDLQGSEGSGSIPASRGSRSDRRAELASFLAAIERRIEDDFFLVLDDFQEVEGSKEIVEALDFLLAHLPDNLHIFTLSTCEPDLDLAKMRGRREVLEIREDQLCFNDEETARLLEDVFSLHVDDGDIADLTDLTEGWITGLILLSHALKSGDSTHIGRMRKEGTLTSPMLFDYFYRVIYGKLDEKLKGFLLRTSILSRVEPGFCDALLEIGDSGLCLSRLAESHLFVVPLDEAGTSYRYHHLLRSFLLEVLSKISAPGEVESLHARAAVLLEERGEIEEALRHYMSAGEPEKAAEKLGGMAGGLIRSGRFTYLRQAIERLPEPILHVHPTLLYSLAQCYERLGAYGQALEIYEKAASIFAERGDLASRMDCMRDGLKLTVLSGRAPEVEASMEEFVDIFEGPALDIDSWFQSAALMSAGSTYLGMADRARGFIAASLARMEDVKDEGARLTMLTWCGYASLLLGEYRQAVELLMHARELAFERDFLFYLPDICCLLSMTHSAMGRYAEARGYAEEGLNASGAAVGEDPIHPASIQNRLALAISSEGAEGDESLLELSRLRRIAEEGEDIWLAINCNLFSGTAYLWTGDLQLSLQCFRRTETLCREKGFLDDELLSSLSRIALTMGEEIDAAEALQEARRIFDTMQSRAAGVLRSASYLLLASILFQSGDEDGALETLSMAVTIDEKSGGLGWWKAYSRLVLPVMSAAFSRGERIDFLSEAFRVIGTVSLPYLYRLRRSGLREAREKARELIEELLGKAADPLEIRMLGSMRVAKGRSCIEEADWRSKRALSVLKYLAAHHARGPVQRDVIMDLLWPDMDPEKASKNLNVALSTIRKTLDPDADWGDSRYLVTSGNSLALEPGEGGWIDIELFRDKVEEALAAREAGDSRIFLQRCLEAEALYGGDFLAEDPYEDWCLPIREALSKAYVDLLRDIADEYIAAGAQDRALAYTEKALAEDPGREDLYRSAMMIHASRGDRAGVEKAFESCRMYLRDSLDVPPSAETLELLEELGERIAHS